jgi:hypothetical protein
MLGGHWSRPGAVILHAFTRPFASSSRWSGFRSHRSTVMPEFRVSGISGTRKHMFPDPILATDASKWSKATPPRQGRRRRHDAEVVSEPPPAPRGPGQWSPRSSLP